MELSKIKDTIQDCHINFLVGAGMSMPYLKTLANIETLLTELDKSDLGKEAKEIIGCSILSEFFKTVIEKNPIIIQGTPDAQKDEVLKNYRDFLTILNLILLKRKSPILNKQINIFTTNIDVFFEKALEDLQLECNDGFSGRMSPIFSLTNFKKSFFQRSSHYDVNSEIPVFNLLKIHGSLTWKNGGDKINLSDLKEIDSIKAKSVGLTGKVINFDHTHNLSHFEALLETITHSAEHIAFLEEYSRLSIVNPTKLKFRETILNLNYYELLRMFSNELEKENSVLFIIGFSLADEHIREILLRVANSNPTLLVVIYAFNADAKNDIQANLNKGNVKIKYDNIKILEPPAGELHTLTYITETVFKAILKDEPSV